MLKHAGLSSDIIQCFYEVYNELGRGYLESVYQNAMIVRFREKFIPAEKEKNIDVYFHEQIVGKFMIMTERNKKVVRVKSVFISGKKIPLILSNKELK